MVSSARKAPKKTPNSARRHKHRHSVALNRASSLSRSVVRFRGSVYFRFHRHRRRYACRHFLFPPLLQKCVLLPLCLCVCRALSRRFFFFFFFFFDARVVLSDSLFRRMHARRVSKPARTLRVYFFFIESFVNFVICLLLFFLPKKDFGSTFKKQTKKKSEEEGTEERDDAQKGR